MILPDFIIIGGMKCGSSTLHRNLVAHPQIGMSRIKEANYFSSKFSAGVTWYSNLFEEGKKFYGETSPTYSKIHWYPETAKRMYDAIPNGKLIYIVRDPVERIVSHLHHNLYRDRFQMHDLDHEVLNNPDYIATSKYYHQLSYYLQHFRQDKILLLTFEMLRKDVTATLNEICKFIGADERDFSESSKVYNSTDKKYWIYQYDRIHRSFPAPVKRLYHLLFYFINRDIARPKLKDATLKEIKSQLVQDVEALKKFSGNTFDQWKMYNSIVL